MKVLIVDDDFVSRRLIQTVLSHYGFADIDMVVNGSEAVQAVEIANGKGNPYELIFLDRLMPGAEGAEILKKLRDKETEAGLEREDAARIIMVTSVNDPGKVMDAFKDQCDQYVIKPINEEKIAQAMMKAGIQLG